MPKYYHFCDLLRDVGLRLLCLGQDRCKAHKRYHFAESGLLLKNIGIRSMSILTIVEASKQFNVTRPRIYRAIQRGELTTTLNTDGVQVVQIQDMIRLFDNIKKKSVSKNVRHTVSDTDIKLIEILEEQLKKSEEDKAFLKQQIIDIRQDFNEYKLQIEDRKKTNEKTDVTSNDHVQEEKSLQVEHAEKTTVTAQLDDQIEKPVKKSLFSRLVSEILR